MQTSFLTPIELSEAGFMSYGSDVLVSRYARFYNPGNVIIGSHVRIDDFCIVSAGAARDEAVIFGGFNHIAAGVQLYGRSGILIGQHVQISMQSIVLSQSDDFSGRWLNGPMVLDELRHVQRGRIKLENFSIVGARSTLMPGVTMNEGAVLGAHSFAKRDVPDWQVWVGAPARFHSHRLRRCAELVGTGELAIDDVMIGDVPLIPL